MNKMTEHGGTSMFSHALYCTNFGQPKKYHGFRL